MERAGRAGAALRTHSSPRSKSADRSMERVPQRCYSWFDATHTRRSKETHLGHPSSQCTRTSHGTPRVAAGCGWEEGGLHTDTQTQRHTRARARSTSSSSGGGGGTHRQSFRLSSAARGFRCIIKSVHPQMRAITRARCRHRRPAAAAAATTTTTTASRARRRTGRISPVYNVGSLRTRSSNHRCGFIQMPRF